MSRRSAGRDLRARNGRIDLREVLRERANGEVELGQSQSHSGFQQQPPVFRQGSRARQPLGALEHPSGDSIAGIAIALLEVRFALEDELRTLFPDCETGAMPPFGPLYGQRVVVDTALAAEPEIVFNAGTHSEAIRMRYADCAAAAKPTVGRCAER